MTTCQLLNVAPGDCETFINESSEAPEQIAQAAALLRAGQVVAFPTETVYGLGANCFDSEAVQRIFEAKGRPSDNPLIVHVSDFDMLRDLLQVPPIYTQLLHKFWPGPLTVLMPKPASIPLAVTGGHHSVAIRMPSHPVARAVIKMAGFPIAAPSANTSGRPSPTLASHVFNDLHDRILLILDGGPCIAGLESTVLDGLSPVPAILRPGSITHAQIASVPGFENVRVWNRDFRDDKLEQAPTTPGMKYRHYSPNCEVIVVLCKTDDRDAKMAQRRQVQKEVDSMRSTRKCKVAVIRTGPKTVDTDFLGDIEYHIGDTNEIVGRNLFKSLREMEDLGADIVVVEGVDDKDEGLAVMNRLCKSASKIVDQI